jgi:hypothetical protein
VPANKELAAAACHNLNAPQNALCWLKPINAWLMV